MPDVDTEHDGATPGREALIGIHHELVPPRHVDRSRQIALDEVAMSHADARDVDRRGHAPAPNGAEVPRADHLWQAARTPRRGVAVNPTSRRLVPSAKSPKCSNTRR